MRWTRERPTRQGFYWLRQGADDSMPQVVWLLSSGQVALPGIIDSIDVVSLEQDFELYWSGPLAAPEGE